MSKELQAFKRFRDNAKFDNKSDYYLSTQYIDDNDIIETALKDLEWLKSKLDIDFMNRLSVPEDKIRLLKIMGLEIEFNE